MSILIPSCSVCDGHEHTPEASGHCLCGASAAKIHKKVEAKISREIHYLIIGFCIALIPSILFLSQYHGYGTDVVGLKIGQSLNINSAESQLRLGEVCTLIHRFDCARSAYQIGTQRFPQDLNLWLNWAKMESKQKQPAQAAVAYAGYFANGGTDYLLRYKWGKALEEAGQIEQAITHYKGMLEAQPGVLQVSVAQTLVGLLIAQKRFDEALQSIQSFQSQADNGKDYLNEELSKVRELLKTPKA